MKSMKLMAEGLGRPVVWVAGVQKRFGLPVLESYPEGYESFLRKILHLRVLGVSEETLREFWAVEWKLIEVLHLDPQSSPTWMVDACAVDADPEMRLLLSNIDLGSPLLATDLQIGLNFAAAAQELFAGKEMGEDSLKVLQDYRTRLVGIRSTVASESKILRDALKWGKGCDKTARFRAKTQRRRDAERMNQGISASNWTSSWRAFGLDIEMARR